MADSAVADPVSAFPTRQGSATTAGKPKAAFAFAEDWGARPNPALPSRLAAGPLPPFSAASAGAVPGTGPAMADATTAAQLLPPPTALDAEAAARFEHVVDAWAVHLKRDLLTQAAQLRGDILSESQVYATNQRESLGRQVCFFPSFSTTTTTTTPRSCRSLHA